MKLTPTAPSTFTPRIKQTRAEHARIKQRILLQPPMLTLAAGRIWCVTGPKGSGKTTFVRLLARVSTPHAGKMRGRFFRMGKRSREPQSVQHSETKPVRRNERAAHKDNRLRLVMAPHPSRRITSHLRASTYLSILLRKQNMPASARHAHLARAATLAKDVQFADLTSRLTELDDGHIFLLRLIAGLMYDPTVLIIDGVPGNVRPPSDTAAARLIRKAAAGGTCIVATADNPAFVEHVATHTLVLVNGHPVIAERTAAIAKKYGSVTSMLHAVLGEHGEHAIAQPRASSVATPNDVRHAPHMQPAYQASNPFATHRPP